MRRFNSLIVSCWALVLCSGSLEKRTVKQRLTLHRATWQLQLFASKTQLQLLESAALSQIFPQNRSYSGQIEGLSPGSRERLL